MTKLYSNTLTRTTRPEPMLYADSARGVYIPQHFAQTIRQDAIRNVRPELLDVLAAGPDGPDYWEIWQDVVDNASVTDAGVCYFLHEDGDLWLIPDGMEWSDRDAWFIWPDDYAERDYD